METLDIRRLESPDEVRRFERGSFELVNLGGMTIGRATYEPAGSGRSTWGTGRTRAIAGAAFGMVVSGHGERRA